MTMFTNPVLIGSNYLWLLVPLCMVLALVYKTIRVQYLRHLPLAVLGLWVYILLGLSALGAAFYLLLEYVA